MGNWVSGTPGKYLGRELEATTTVETWEAPKGIEWGGGPPPPGCCGTRGRGLSQSLSRAPAKRDGRWEKNPGGRKGLECEVREDLS